MNSGGERRTQLGVSELGFMGQRMGVVCEAEEFIPHPVIFNPAMTQAGGKKNPGVHAFC